MWNSHLLWFPLGEEVVWHECDSDICPFYIYKKRHLLCKVDGKVFGVFWPPGILIATRWPERQKAGRKDKEGNTPEKKMPTPCAITVANCLSSDLLSPRVMLGLTSSTVKYPNFRACQLPSALIPQGLLKRKEALRSPLSICTPIRRPGVFSRSTCLSWATAGLPLRRWGLLPRLGARQSLSYPADAATGWVQVPVLLLIFIPLPAGHPPLGSDTSFLR